jgi:hypothetical protein
MGIAQTFLRVVKNDPLHVTALRAGKTKSRLIL